MRRPAWAAAPGFAQAWVAAEHDFPEALDLLRLAHCIAVDPAQVRVLPGGQTGRGTMRYEEHAEVLRHVRLPFDVVWVDTGGVSMEPGTSGTSLLGAIAITEEGVPASPARSTEGVGVIPVFKDNKTGACIALPMLATWAEGKLATLNIGGRLDPTDPVVEEAQEIVADGAGVVAAVLSWLESMNVELVEAPLSPRQRMREQGKGRKIALTVQVRPPKSKPVGRNGKANYSHRFEVRGHYMHFPEGTKVGDAAPEKLSFVPGRGFVRKVWCPPHVKGPIDKPLIPKVRVVDTSANTQ